LLLSLLEYSVFARLFADLAGLDLVVVTPYLNAVSGSFIV